MTRILYIENENSLHWMESPGLMIELENEVREGLITRHLLQKDFGLPLSTHKSEAAHSVRVGNLLVVIPVSSMQPLDKDSLSPSGIALTPRQNQVLQALTNGFSTKQIASQLHLSERTILMHIHALKERLGVITREQVILKALSLGLLENK